MNKIKFQLTIDTYAYSVDRHNCIINSQMKMGSTSRIAKAAITQLCATNNKQSNLINIAKCAGLAKQAGAQMLFLPECLGFMGDNAKRTLDNADPSIDELMDMQQKNGDCFSCTCTSSYDATFRKEISNTISSSATNAKSQVDINKEEPTAIKSIISELCFIANESSLWISGGGIHTSVPSQSDETPERKIYNTHVIINDKGQIKSYYHKIHLFDVSIPNKVNLQESKTTSPGNKLVVCDSPIGKLGLSICYDLRFPEMYVKLVQEMGAEVLLMPSAFTVPTGKAHWHALLKGE